MTEQKQPTSGNGHAGHECARCQAAATMQCPRCLELGLEQEFACFCSQECFKVTQAMVSPYGCHPPPCRRLTAGPPPRLRPHGQSTSSCTSPASRGGTIVRARVRGAACTCPNSSGRASCGRRELGPIARCEAGGGGDLQREGRCLPTYLHNGQRHSMHVYPPKKTLNSPLNLLHPCPQIPDHIPKPDYYEDGIPHSEMKSRQQKERE